LRGCRLGAFVDLELLKLNRLGQLSDPPKTDTSVVVREKDEEFSYKYWFVVCSRNVVQLTTSRDSAIKRIFLFP
jgi:hypothetical protein